MYFDRLQAIRCNSLRCHPPTYTVRYHALGYLSANLLAPAKSPIEVQLRPRRGVISTDRSCFHGPGSVANNTHTTTSFTLHDANLAIPAAQGNPIASWRPGHTPHAQTWIFARRAR
jgi:hypothetical protein